MNPEFITMVAAIATMGVASLAVYLAWSTQKVLEETQDIIHQIGIITGIKAGIEHGPAVMIGLRVSEALQKDHEEGKLTDEDIDKMTDDAIQEGLKRAG